VNVRAGLDLGPLNDVFGQLKRRANDFRKPFQQVGEKGREQFKKRFDQSGPGWAPNKAGTKTLIKTGELLASFVTVGAVGNLSVIGRDEAVFGSNLPKAKILQEGGTETFTSEKGQRYTIKFPARPIVVEPSSVFKNQIGQIAGAHFDNLKPGDRSV
jgi:phage gpG-like protein